MNDLYDDDGFPLDEREREWLELEARYQAERAAANNSSGEEEQNEPLSRDELAERCSELIKTNSVLDLYEETLRRAGKFAGSALVVKVIILAVVSRLLSRPVSVLVRGESSAGKSYAIEQAIQFMAPESTYVLTGMSEKALAYSEEVLSHRFLVLYEENALQGKGAAYMTRTLLSEGKLSYEYTDFDNGRKTARIEKEGPTGLITSTAGKIDYELGTRLLSVNIDESPEMTKMILAALATAAEGFGEAPELGPFHAFDRWLRSGPKEVLIPFAQSISNGCDPSAVRMRRDFEAVLGLTKAHALMHQAHREVNGAGQVLASVEDYAVVYALVAEAVAQSSGKAIPKAVRRVVEAVKDLLYSPPISSLEHATIKTLADHMGVNRSSVSRAVKAAETLELLENVGTPSQKKLKPAERMIEDGSALPDPETLDLD